MVRPVERVIPIFGYHDWANLVSQKAEALQASVKMGKFVDEHIWDLWTVDQISRLKPRVLSLDGVHGDGSSSLETLQNIFLVSPINPFDLRRDGKDTFIVGGDICCASSEDPVVQYAFDKVVADKMNAPIYVQGLLNNDISEANDLRNALITVKLKDGVLFLPNEKIEEDPVAILGNGHEYGKRPEIWDSETAQQECLGSVLTRLFEEAFALSRLDGLRVEDRLMQRFVQGFNEMMGTLDIWRIGNGQSLDVEEVRRNLTLETSVVSPTFAQISATVGNNVLQRELTSIQNGR